MDKKNPFLLRFYAPTYLAAATVAITNDFLMAIMFMLFTLGILGAYVTEFPIFPTLCQNEILHKAAISAPLGMGLRNDDWSGYSGVEQKARDLPQFQHRASSSC